ncbi:hypothetical protein [Amycolatopsis sp. NPDC051371]|uniref:hypothetical protein n=1 Tax=Amycolatopsis sp. NPDC051371 TaxID=3155800 RepID=UPI0034198391
MTRHLEPGWDLHRAGSAERFVLPAGEVVDAEVVCHHPFGLGLHLAEYDAYAHVDIPEVGGTLVRGPADFPAVGSAVRARSFGPSGEGRPLTMSLRGLPSSLTSSSDAR